MYSTSPEYGLIMLVLPICIVFLAVSVYMGLKRNLKKETSIITAVSVVLLIIAAILGNGLYLGSLIISIGFIVYCKAKHEINSPTRVYEAKSNKKLLWILVAMQIMCIILTMFPLWFYESGGETYFITGNTVIFGGSATDYLISQYASEHDPFSLYKNIYYIIPLYVLPLICTAPLIVLKGNKKKHFIIAIVLVYISSIGLGIVDGLAAHFDGMIRVLSRTAFYKAENIIQIIEIIIAIVGIVLTRYKTVSKGTINNNVDSSIGSTKTLYCSQCGCENKFESDFCCNCGSKLNKN